MTWDYIHDLRLRIGMPLTEFWELSWRHFFKAVEFHSYREWLDMHKTRLVVWGSLKPHMKKKNFTVTDVMTLEGDDLFFRSGKKVSKEDVNKLIEYSRQFIDG